MLSKEKLIEYDSQGWIPGPSETEEEFLARIEHCKNLRALFIEKDLLSSSFKEEVSLLETGSDRYAQRIYGIAPQWVPLFFSNHKLLPWHGGAAWIFQFEESSPLGALLQLRSVFQRSSTFLKVYSREETITHELSHIGRMAFEEPQFEEILAYHSSSSSWRRFWGGIVQSGRESSFFLLILISLFFFDIALLFTGGIDRISPIFWINLLPTGMIFFACFRLIKRQWQFKKLLQKLSLFVLPGKDPFHVIYRLTDREIIFFSKSSEEIIKQYARESRESSLRWRLLYTYFFMD